VLQGIIVVMGLSAGLSALLIAIALHTGLAARIIDTPNERSLHVRPIPRSGGILFMPLALLAACVGGALAIWPLLAVAAMLVVVFVLDDIYGLPVPPRLGMQIAAAAGVIWLAWPVSWPVTVFGLLAIIWSCNVFNFMDGANGLAAGMAACGFGTYALAAAQAGEVPLAILSAAIAGSALGFLWHNFDPARIFMGDAGAIPLGFLAAAVGFLGWRQQIWGWWFPMLVFSPFLMDATVMILRRLRRGDRVTVAHRDHYYQRLVRAGLSHRALSLISYLLMLAAAGSAILLLQAPWLVLPAAAVWLLFYFAAFLYIDLRMAPLAPRESTPAPLGRDRV
jgi:UDP-N-acetylmuramyl pentapeptide phosphotransferase/UDP-N-acetylglucosamine-1-phosphate transferase